MESYQVSNFNADFSSQLQLLYRTLAYEMLRRGAAWKPIMVGQKTKKRLNSDGQETVMEILTGRNSIF